MNLSYSQEYLSFQAEVRLFLSQQWDRSRAKEPGYVQEFRSRATGRGLLYRAIPRLYGGSEQPPDVLKAQIIREEFAQARAPMEVPGNGVSMVVPTLLECGEPWQCERFIPRSLTGEYRWAQGYSEPGSGSDLASLKTKAELVGDEWVINGQKIWTTLAHEANYMFCLCRTEPDAPKHEGISYLLFDFKQPGVTVRPIKQITGGADFCETFLDNVRTPANWIVGKRGEGWRVSKSTLKHERNSVGSAAGLRDLFHKLVRLAQTTPYRGDVAIADAAIRQRIATLDGYVQAHLYSGYYQLTKAALDESAGNLGLINKINTTNIGQEIAGLVTDIIQDDALSMPDFSPKRRGNSHWVNQIFGSLGLAIAGGTSNIQRKIIAERGLELPREVDGE
ncbi:MAG: acyl-CoA dehydrogenase family protein [Steroidobacteraceae bacterium]